MFVMFGNPLNIRKDEVFYEKEIDRRKQPIQAPQAEVSAVCHEKGLFGIV